MLSVHISSYGCTREVKRAREKRESSECSPNFPSVSITRYTHVKHKAILDYNIAGALVLSNSYWAFMNKISL